LKLIGSIIHRLFAIRLLRSPILAIVCASLILQKILQNLVKTVNIHKTVQELLSEVTELIYVKNARALPIVDSPLNEKRMGIWIYYGNVGGPIHR
jgi:hypothetical protein